MKRGGKRANFIQDGLTECTNNSIQMRLSFYIASTRRDVLFFLIIIISLVIILQWSAKVSVYYCTKFKGFFGFSKAEHFYFLSTSDLILWPYLPYHLVRVCTNAVCHIAIEDDQLYLNDSVGKPEPIR